MRAANLSFSLPRNPLLRALVLTAGAVVLVGLVAMSLLVGVAVVVIAGLVILTRHWLGRGGRRRTDPDIIEGEFSVVPPRPHVVLPDNRRA